MPCTNEFGVIDNFNKEKEYIDYEPEKYDCISIDDDIIVELWSSLSLMCTYLRAYNKPFMGLDHWGITIIPPESLAMFLDIIVSSKQYKCSDVLNRLGDLILKAIKDQKYMIHYGL